MSKWKLALDHAWPSLVGLLRALWTHPLFTARLVVVRLHFFLTGRLLCPVATPDAFLIETSNELISYWSFFIEREGWDRQWTEALQRTPKAVVLDVGANAGLFSHLVWTLQPGAVITAFDPLPKMADKIQRWGAKTGAQLTVHNVAVSDRCGTALFYIGSENDPTASLKDDGSKARSLSVPVATLDSLVAKQPILLIKIDVEGVECEVLAGGKRTVQNARFLLIEAHTEQALARIRQQLGADWNDKQVGASDYLFMRKPGASPEE